VITAAIAVFILLAFLDIPVHAKALQKQATSYFSDFQQGLTYIKNHDFLKKFFMFYAVFFVLIAPAAFLTPLQVTRSFGDDVWRLTAIEITYSIGMMLGGVFMAGRTGRKQSVSWSTIWVIGQRLTWTVKREDATRSWVPNWLAAGLAPSTKNYVCTI